MSLVVVAVGLGLFSLLGVDTPLPQAGAYMLVLLGAPDAIAALARPVRDTVLGGFADSLSDLYTIAVPIALLGFVVVLFLPELPLRTSVRDHEPVVTDGEAVSAALETSFVDDNADVPDLTDSGGESDGRNTDAASNA